MSTNHQTYASCGCEECKPRALARNHYFTGKLLVERDFSDEQWFFREKIRLHHQRLHGTGIVCGLSISEHPNANCQDHLVIVEPGSAIDCCGHDILVAEKETWDFTSAPEVKALIQAKDTDEHVLEFCIAWRECPTEEIPVLYDECGCNDLQCAPNRILESYALEVRVHPPGYAPPIHSYGARFEWGARSIDIAHATAVALDENGQRVFVAAGTPAETLYQVGTQHLLTEASVPTGRAVLDLALSPDGHTLYAAVAPDPATSTDPPELWIFTPDAGTGIVAGPARYAPLGAAAEPGIALTVAGDGRLLVVATASGHIWLFPAGVADPSTPSATGTLGGARSPAVFSSDGNTAWLGQSTAAFVDTVDLTQATLNATPVAIAGISADGVALVSTGSGADRLAIIDRTNNSLHLVDPANPAQVQSAPLTSSPLFAVIDSGRGTAIVASAKALQAVNLVVLASGTSNAVSAEYPIEANIGRAALTNSGRRLFVPFSGDPSVAESGGVAVVDIGSADCRDALRGQACPACGVPDCLTLALVRGWSLGRKLEDVQDPPTDPTKDAANGIARIDNSARTVLASTQAITQALTCIMDHAGVGGTGPQVPAVPSGIRTDLTGISALNWTHGGSLSTQDLMRSGLVISFSAPVQTSDLHDQSIMLLVPQVSKRVADLPVTCWCQLAVPITALNLVTPPTTPPTCNAVGMKLNDSQVNALMEKSKSLALRVQVHGDLIRDKNNLGLDANHLPPWLPPPPKTGKTGDGIPGGLFESWFTLTLSP
ncbi:YncE family protein [Paraburkholderia sp. MM5477-R1]|uniref:YncE family protein n=1 Tax=Paraburkholderia sp. MM5477-R1 TaxID=2991062 RepID=UPI003D1C6A3C